MPVLRLLSESVTYVELTLRDGDLSELRQRLLEFATRGRDPIDPGAAARRCHHRGTGQSC
jgi:hypothetical protein